MKYFLLIIFLFLIFSSQTQAAVDPRLSPNNKFGINSLAPELEVKSIHELVNTNGQWGWVVLVIRKSERDTARWQKVFHDLNRHKIIPIVRIATDFEGGGIWQKPSEEDASSWAQFLDSLKWPTQNRYIQVYNEVNRATEWGGEVNPSGYAKELEKTIQALKAKNSDFFVLNAPLDLALASSENSLDAFEYMDAMEQEVPGIFTKIDGWASHSYPNPDFSSHPTNNDRRSVAGYRWELAKLKELQSPKDPPVFITETGWRRGDDQKAGLTDSEIASFYRLAFEDVWKDENLVVVAPFVLSYHDPQFYEFSFLSSKPDKKVYDFYNTIRDLPKVKGEPVRNDSAITLKLKKPNTVIKNSPARLQLQAKNTGNHIWHTEDGFSVILEGQNISVEEVLLDKDEILPGEEVNVQLKIKGTEQGELPYSIVLRNDSNTILSENHTVTSKTYLNAVLDLFKSAMESPG